MVYSVKGLAFLSIALGVGYIVCVAASKEKGILKNIGYIIGALIIGACIAGAIMRICTAGGIPICPMMK